MKKNNFKIYVTLFIIILTKFTSVFGVDLGPKIIPPSPHAQEFTKYIDYPVNFSSGLPNNDIPLYTVKCGSLVLPISVSYKLFRFKSDCGDRHSRLRVEFELWWDNIKNN